MTLYEIVVAVTILACAANLTCSVVVFLRLGKPRKAVGWWTPDQVRAIESCKPGDTILLTTDQHFTATQRTFIREWAEEMKAKTGVWLVVLEGGMRPAPVRSTPVPSDVVIRVQREAAGRLLSAGITRFAAKEKLEANAEALTEQAQTFVCGWPASLGPFKVERSGLVVPVRFVQDGRFRFDESLLKPDAASPGSSR